MHDLSKNIALKLSFAHSPLLHAPKQVFFTATENNFDLWGNNARKYDQWPPLQLKASLADALKTTFAFIAENSNFAINIYLSLYDS